VAVYRVAYESIGRARQGRGPTLIECRDYVCKNRKRTFKDESKPLEVQDPIRRMETYLLGKGLFNPGLKRKIAAAFRRELEEAAGLSKS
jgi:acetoin:2,6-dichlorophenolindophenol oxidoreductase subunit alpha